MSRLVLALTVAATLALAVGCAPSNTGGVGDPPTDPPATTGAPSPTPSPIPRGPRLLLQHFLHAVATDDVTACRLVSTTYEHSVSDGFGGEGGCANALAKDKRLMGPDQVRELRSVEVLNGVSGPEPGQYTVTYADLQWPEGRLTMDILAVQYVLARLNGKWKIVG